uniref:Uncharacterized protein n=1 Tax=Nelumbo nucifera TaxID=4432 RepID=A0A822XGQ8_NELNU|nr:TPA_asm: hypothetical protein HUJ06_020316 [Nelumbo nucifera]
MMLRLIPTWFSSRAIGIPILLSLEVLVLSVIADVEKVRFREEEIHNCNSKVESHKFAEEELAFRVPLGLVGSEDEEESKSGGKMPWSKVERLVSTTTVPTIHGRCHH